MDDAPRGEIVGQQSPGATAAHPMEYRIEDGALGVTRRSSEELGAGNQGRDELPFKIGEAAGIGLMGWHP